ncbi:Polypyrimidine tract-binding protein, putative [Pediculus humanus corporis]|uniref:Polypyrimidine tract-binding protein, putative n=1 Tax=Pediculus humanus subsp. corporis TaxID=121224 RepID=E0W1E9_PEDHC|nr:Polypyrimidine tract-binding protein, putative [Pediculus humanus corporis]EEB19455.1 Polypyrimidine tract-binding protein, putative [Pediculus humanus corporis]
MSPQPNHSENNNDAKKVKLDKNQNVKPSKVIHIRNIPSDVSEPEIIHLGIPFGRVTNVLVLKGKNQVRYELSASEMVSYFTSCAAQLRGRAVFVQFSNHKELKTDQTHSNANASAQAALQAAQALSGSIDTQGGPNTVLRVIIEHMVYPVTLDVLYKVRRKILLTRQSFRSFQALIQYPDVITAQAAKLSLDGRNIYNSCCTLRIEYSKLSALNVKYNNDKSRDYTNPNLPTGDSGLDGLGLGGADILPQLLMANSTPSRHRSLPTDMQARLAAGDLTSPLAFAGSPVTSGMPLAGFALPGANAALGVPGIRLPGSGGCVLLVSNLNQEMVTPDALFTLFGVYGDVQRVKILYNKKDSALVQMAEPLQAHIAMKHLDQIRVFGKNITVVASKHTLVQMPKDGQPDAGLTKDYVNSPLHRFKKPGSKNYQNIYPPSSTLHLSNIPPTVTEEDIEEAFAEAGFEVKSFKFFPKDKKMALINLESVDQAVSALIKMHNHQLSESNHLRVSFSKTNI